VKQVFVARRGQSLVPVSPMDVETIEELPEGQEMTARLTRRRSLPMHRRYWSILHAAVASTAAGGTWPTADHLHRALLLMTGRVTPVKARSDDGWVTHMIPDSTAFAAMDQTEFGQYHEDAMGVLEMLGIDVVSLEREAAE